MSRLTQEKNTRLPNSGGTDAGAEQNHKLTPDDGPTRAETTVDMPDDSQLTADEAGAGDVTPGQVIIRVERVDCVSDSEDSSGPAGATVPAPGPAYLSRSLLELPPTRCAVRRHSEPWQAELENQAFRLSLFLNDPAPGGRRRRSARPGNRPRRHSATPNSSGRRGSSSLSSRGSRRPSAASRRSSVPLLGGAVADLLPSAADTPKERRRRRAVLATLAGTGLLLLLAVGLVLGSLHLSDVRPAAPGTHGETPPEIVR